MIYVLGQINLYLSFLFSKMGKTVYQTLPLAHGYHATPAVKPLFSLFLLTPVACSLPAFLKLRFNSL